MNFSSFTNLFFYLFVVYQYSNYKYPEKTQEYIFIISYNSVYYFSKLQLFFNKIISISHSYLSKYEEYNSFIAKIIELKHQARDLFLLKSHMQCQSENNQIFVDIICSNKLQQTINANDFIENIITKIPVNDFNFYNTEFDFLIINGKSNMKKIIRKCDILFEKKQDDSFDYDGYFNKLFDIQSLSYKPLLCEIILNDGIIKIEFFNNEKGYNFLVVDNYVDNKFLSYFMEKYYNVKNINDYILKILNNSVEFITFESSHVLKFDINDISKL
jgi:hypothetical protein